MEISLGVLLEEASMIGSVDARDDLDETGHVPAAGRHRFTTGNRVVEIGETALRAAAVAVGREVGVVVAGVVGGIEGPTEGSFDGSFAIDNLELKFGVKAVLGTGKAIEALLTASGEATVEVTLKLQKRLPGDAG